mgnify:CR=1 FL=1
MELRRFLTVVFAGVLLPLLGCQPDQRPADWRVDGGTDLGTDAEMDGGSDAGADAKIDVAPDADEDSGSPPLAWDGEWERLPSPRGGAAAEKVGGQLLMWTRSKSPDYQYEFSHFSTNGTDWKPASESPLASKFEGLEEAWYVEFAEARYLLITNREGGRGLNRRVHVSLDEQDEWYEETHLGAITAPNSAYTVQGSVVATSPGMVHRRESVGSWTDITPSGEFQGEIELEVAGPLIVFHPRLPEKTRVTTDLGETWTKPDLSRYATPVLTNVVHLGDTYYTLATTEPAEEEGSRADTQFLLNSSDGTSWSSTEINSEASVNPISLTALDGELYALDSRSRLVRIRPNVGQVTFVTGSEFHTQGDYNGLFEVDSTLVASSPDGNIGSVLTWQPGDSGWSLPDSAPINAHSIDVREGRLRAKAVEYQVYDREARRWRLTGPQAPESTERTGDGRVAWNPQEGCVYLRDGDGWEPRLQWTESGFVESCSDHRRAVEIADVVAYRDGYAMAVRPPSDGKILVHWNPESGAIESLNPEDVFTSQLPVVEKLMTQEGELWIRTAPEEGASELAGGIFRLRNESWQALETERVDGEGPEYVVEDKEWGALENHGGEVFAKVTFQTPVADVGATSFVRWVPQQQSFHWVNPPEGASLPTFGNYNQALHTRLGPTLVSDDQLWRFDIGANEWQAVGQTFPEGSFRPQQVAAGERAVYVETLDGRIFVTRATPEGTPD